MSIFKRKQKPPSKLNHVYTDKFGNKWFELDNILELARVRYIASSLKELQADLFNLSAETLLQVLDLISQHINEGNIAKAGAVAEITKVAIEDFTDLRLLKKYACVFYFLEGEDISKYESHFEKRKMEIFEQDEDACDFFLSMSLKKLSSLEDSSKTDIETYLRKIKKRWEDFNTSIGHLAPKKSST